MNEIEYELTYLAKEIPKGLFDCEHKEIIDLYLPKNDPNRRVRLRKSGDKFEITKKSVLDESDFSTQMEETIKLNEEEFNELLVVDGLKISKKRYYYKVNEMTAEVDVFDEDLKGLVVVDFEFESEEDKANFEMPDFCLVDVTQELFIAGGQLAGLSYDDIKDKLGKFNYKKLL